MLKSVGDLALISLGKGQHILTRYVTTHQVNMSCLSLYVQIFYTNIHAIGNVKKVLERKFCLYE